MDFTSLKKECSKTCHQRHACKEGFTQMLNTTTVGQMVAVWKDNLSDIVGERYADIIRERLKEFYYTMEKDFNDAGLYLNRCPETSSSDTLIIVTDSEDTINISGRAVAYVIGKATVVAHDHATVRLKHPDSKAIMYDSTTCYATKGSVIAYDYSFVYSHDHVECHGLSTITCLEGSAKDYSHRRMLVAYDDTTIYTNHPEKISAQSQTVKILPLNK